MIARLGWSIALAALAAMTLVAQLDQAARHTPGFAPMVPLPFRNFAAPQMAGFALVRGDLVDARANVQVLVRARPLPAEHMTLLARLAVMEQNEAVALAAMQSSTLRGWRDPASQMLAAEAALAQGDRTAAAQRITALLAVGGQFQAYALRLLDRLLASPEGRVAFSRHLAEAGRWQANVLVPASEVLAGAQWAQTIALARDRGAALPCDRLGAVARSLQQDGLTQEAALFWPGDCQS